MLATNWENRHLPLDASICENERPVIVKSLHLVLEPVPFYNFNRVAVVEISRLPSRIDVHTVFRSLDEMPIRSDTNPSNHRFFIHLTKLFPVSIIFTLLSAISNFRDDTTIDNSVFYVVGATTTNFGSDSFNQVAIISFFPFFFAIAVFLHIRWTILLFLLFLYAVPVSLKNVGTSPKPFGTRRNVYNESCWLCAETFYIRYK